jgi:hypothetical protein
MVFGPTCERCDGSKLDPDTGESCQLCEGRGDKWVYRCPASQMTVETNALVRMWGPYQNGLLPDEGGVYDQSACFVRAMGVLATEKAAIEELERPTGGGK